MLDSIKNRIESDYFLFNVLDGTNQKPDGQMGTLMGNVVLFCKTLLQKLYDGSFTADSKVFLEFFSDQIMMVRGKKCFHQKM